MSGGDKGGGALLLPALDKASGGVQWSSVARLVAMIRDANSISKHLRYSIKSRLTCGEEPRVLNTLTVLHTISLNGSLEVRRQLSNTKHLRLLEKVYMSFCAELAAAAVCQLLVDWTFMFSNEELGQNSARLLKHLKTKGAPSLRATKIAAARREEMMLGVPALRFVPGMDFTAPTTPNSEVRSGGSQNGPGESAPARGSKLSKLKRLFSRAPSTPARMRETMSLQTENPRNGQRCAKEKDRTPAWVEEMLDRMPVDASDLAEVVGSIETLREGGGSDADISGMMAATEPLAKKVTTWHNWAQELVASQMDSIAADMMTGTQQVSQKHANLTLDSGKLTRLLEANEEVQRVVEAWKRLQREVSTSTVLSGPMQTTGTDSMPIVRRSVSVMTPSVAHRRSIDTSPTSFAGVDKLNRALQSAESANPRMHTPRTYTPRSHTPRSHTPRSHTPRTHTPHTPMLPKIPTGQELCYDQRSGDYAGTYDDGTDDTPMSDLTDNSGLTPFGIDLEMRTWTTAEDSYSYEAVAGSWVPDPNGLTAAVPSPTHQASPKWMPVQENVHDVLPEDTISFPRHSDLYVPPRANIKEMEADLRNFGMEPRSPSPRRRTDRDGGAALPFENGGQRQSGRADRNGNNPFRSSSPLQYSHAEDDRKVWTSADVGRQAVGQVAAVVSPFQEQSRSTSKSTPPTRPADASPRRSLQIEEGIHAHQRNTPAVVGASLAIRVDKDGQKEPTRLSALSSSPAGVCVEEQYDGRDAAGTSAGPGAGVGSLPFYRRRSSPTGGDKAQSPDDRASRKTERRVRSRHDKTKHGSGRKHSSAKLKRHPFGDLAAEGRGSPINEGAAGIRQVVPRHHSPQRSAEQSATARKKHMSRRVQKVQQKTRPQDGGRRSVPTLGLENKLLLKGRSAAPKIVTASLDALREQPSHRIPALRVRFTQAHLREVLEKLADKGSL